MELEVVANLTNFALKNVKIYAYMPEKDSGITLIMPKLSSPVLPKHQ